MAKTVSDVEYKMEKSVRVSKEKTSPLVKSLLKEAKETIKENVDTVRLCPSRKQNGTLCCEDCHLFTSCKKLSVPDCEYKRTKDGIQAFLITDGGWLLEFFKKIFRDGSTVWSDVFYFVDNCPDWIEFKGKIIHDLRGKYGFICATEYFGEKNTGVAFVLSLIEHTLKALEPYFPKDLPKES